MESVTKAKDRFSKYPLIFAKCSKQATLYARCVLLHDGSVKKEDCGKEFKEFSSCLKSAATGMKTRI